MANTQYSVLSGAQGTISSPALFVLTTHNNHPSSTSCLQRPNAFP